MMHAATPPMAVPTPGATAVPAAAPPAPASLQPTQAPAHATTTSDARRNGLDARTIETTSIAAPATSSNRPAYLKYLAAWYALAPVRPAGVWSEILNCAYARC